MTKMMDKEDPLQHTWDHIATAATRSVAALELMDRLIDAEPGSTIEGVANALDSMQDHVNWAIRHIRQMKL